VFIPSQNASAASSAPTKECRILSLVASRCIIRSPHLTKYQSRMISRSALLTSEKQRNVKVAPDTGTSFSEEWWVDTFLLA